MATDQELRLIIKALKEGQGIEQILDGLDKLKKKGDETNEGVKLLKSTFSALLPAMSAAAVVAAMKNMSDRALEYAEAVDKVGDITGASAEQSSRWVVQAGHVGVSAEAVANGMSILAKNILGGKDALERWGIITTDTNGKLRSMDDIMTQVRVKEKELGDGAQATAMEMDLFGKSGKELHDFLSADAEEMANVTKTAEELGLILSDLDKDKLEQLNRKMNDYKMISQSLGLEINTEVFPALIKMQSGILLIVRAMENWLLTSKIQREFLTGQFQKAVLDFNELIGKGTKEIEKQATAQTIKTEKTKEQLAAEAKATQETADKKSKAEAEFWDRQIKLADGNVPKLKAIELQITKDKKLQHDERIKLIDKISDYEVKKTEITARLMADAFMTGATNIQAMWDKLAKDMTNTVVTNAFKPMAAGLNSMLGQFGDLGTVLAGGVGGLIGGLVGGFLETLGNLSRTTAELVAEKFEWLSERANKAISEIGKEKSYAQKAVSALDSLALGADSTYSGDLANYLGVSGMTQAQAKGKLLSNLQSVLSKEAGLLTKNDSQINTELTDLLAKQKSLQDAQKTRALTGEELSNLVYYQTEIAAREKYLATPSEDRLTILTELQEVKKSLQELVGTPTSANDFISRPGQGIIKISPKDTVVGAKNIGKLGGGDTFQITIQAGALMGNEAEALKFAKAIGYYLGKIERRNLTLGLN
ncbi:MAG: hypothetical protein WC529_08855 [Candidatus Margulisiibacteriota bacterium]